MKTVFISLIVIVLTVTACASHAKPTPTMPIPTDTPIPPTSTPLSQPPDGTYTSSITKQELITAGLSESDACENAGVLSLSVAGDRWSIIQSAAPGCTVYTPQWGGTWKFSGNRVTFHDETPLGCPPDYTYEWNFNGSRIRFASVDDSQCITRVYYLTMHPWVKEK